MQASVQELQTNVEHGITRVALPGSESEIRDPATAGTSLKYKPGFIVGGDITHDCGKRRGIGYFLEPLVILGLFGRKVRSLRGQRRTQFLVKGQLRT